MTTDFSLCANPLEQFLQKKSHEFTVDDIINYVTGNSIEMLDFHYIAGDGRIKTLNFVISGKEQLEQLLHTGERVDGSSLFKFLEAGSSDLYVVPKIRSAFINPFSEIPTIGFFCRYFDKDGQPTPFSPENILIKAHEELKSKTGFELNAMGELEYYVVSEKDELFQATDQRGYHESFPFTKFEDLRKEALLYIARMGGNLKYGHSEVGNFIDDRYNYEQNEIEFLPTTIEEAAEQLILGKWILRGLAYRYGVHLSFAPKITVGKAGSGLHIHMRLMKDGKSAMINNEGILSDEARKAIAGILDLAPSLTAFGNTVPTSYLRLVPHQEAPTSICWGERNRSVLVRVPLGWTGKACHMFKTANPQLEPKNSDLSMKPTFEFRAPDGSADLYLLLAGLTTAVRHGLTMPDALQKAETLKVEVNIFKEENKHIADKLKLLPASCFESAKALEKQASVYKDNGVFPESLIKYIDQKLLSYNDDKLSERLFELPEEERKLRIFELVQRHIDC